MNKLVIISAETIIHLLYMISAIFLLLNKRTFRPNSGPRFTRIIALAQNQLSKSLVQTCYVSHSRQSLFAESRIAYAVSSAHRFSNRTCLKNSLLEIRKPLQPILDSRTRTALTGRLHAIQCISCSARAHHQFYFIQTQFLNVSSLTITTEQVGLFHKSSLVPIKHRVLIMVQQP